MECQLENRTISTKAPAILVSPIAYDCHRLASCFYSWYRAERGIPWRSKRYPNIEPGKVGIAKSLEAATPRNLPSHASIISGQVEGRAVVVCINVAHSVVTGEDVYHDAKLLFVKRVRGSLRYCGALGGCD